MDTPLLDAIRRNRGHLDELELCILWMGDEQQASEDDLETAELAAEELAVLRRIAEVARAVFFSPYPMSSAEYCNARAEVRVAIAEYDKCRAA